MDSLPDDVLESIFRLLPGKQIGAMGMVSTCLYRVSQRVHPWLQKALSRRKVHVPLNNVILPHSSNGLFFQYQHSLDTYDTVEYWSRVCVSHMDKRNGLYEAILNELVKREHHILRESSTDGHHAITKEQRRVVCQRPAKQMIVVQAFAGTGKTTTLYHYAKKWKSHKVLYLAYNRALADESRKRFKELDNVHVMTIHSLALRNVDPNGEISLGNLKLSTIMEAFGSSQVPDIQTAKRVLTEFDMYCSSDSVADPADPMVRALWQRMFTENTLEVTHDAYLKQYQRSMPALNEFDVIMLDEVQDCTDCILHIITSQSHSTRIFVGDVYQKIYGFRHVNEPFQYIVAKCTTNVHEKTSCKCFQLSVSFRMGYDLMHHTNMYLKRAFRTATGFSSTRRNQNTHVTTFDTRRDSITDLPHGTVVLCRYNANVLQFMFQICNLQMSFGFYGKSINFEKEISIVTELYHLDMGEMDQVTTPKLQGFATLDDLHAHFVAMGNNPWKDRIRLYQAYGERLIQMWREAHEHKSQNNDPHIVITTAHQSKGSEFENVVLYDDFPMNNEDAYNTLYVAMTRAKHRLYLNNSLFAFFKKLGKRVVYDDTLPSSFKACSFCNKIKTNQSICVENDKKSIIEGTGCHLYEYVPICNMCKMNTIL